MALHIITKCYENKQNTRIDEYLLHELPEELRKTAPSFVFSKSKNRRLIVAGAVSLNGKQIRNPAATVCRGDTIIIRMDFEKFSFEKQPDDIAFELSEKDILFEDDVIIIVNKPAGIPTEATMVASRDHLHAAVKRFLAQRLRANSDKTLNDPYVGLHHRLDRETSGVILFSKTRTVNAAIFQIFSEHLARKEYEALTIRPRKLPANSFCEDNMMGRISPKSAAGKWGAVTSGGEPAHTDFLLIENKQAFLRIQAMPVTGRTHQIRVHLAGLGMPLLGDTLYGGPSTIVIKTSTADEPVKSNTIENQTTVLEASAFKRKSGPLEAYSKTTMIEIPRVMLHASRLTFPHPVTGKIITVEAPLPEDFLKIFQDS